MDGAFGQAAPVAVTHIQNEQNNIHGHQHAIQLRHSRWRGATACSRRGKKHVCGFRGRHSGQGESHRRAKIAVVSPRFLVLHQPDNRLLDARA